jgi:hypothetical protein
MNRPLNLLFGLGLVGAALLVPAAARADVVFSNFGPGLSFDQLSGTPVGNAFDGNNYAEAASFSAATPFVFDSLLIALSCVASCPATLTVTLAASSGAAPGAAIESFVVAGSALGAFGVNHAPLTLASVLHPGLGAGTVYWVTVKSTTADAAAWNLNLTADASATGISSDGGATWFAPAGQTPGAYAINSAVPEPAAWASLLGGALLVGWRRRRTRR